MHRRARDKRFIALLTLVILSLGNIIALAQSTATIQGAVTDASGAVIANAKVSAKNLGTGLERTTTSDSSGNYQIASLPIGTYKLEIRADGFQPEAISGLVLQVSQTVVQNVQMKIGGVTQEVTVTAEAPVVESSTITVGQVIDRRTVQDIPLNGRHFVDLGLLSAGTVTPPQSGFLTAPLRGQGSFAINTAGNREDTVNFMINGINLNDMVQNQITFQPSINTVQEFKVNNSTFSSEYGRNSGAIVNIATRSGTNEWHGEAFEFLRNDVFDAKNFFTVGKKAPFKRNQFGANFGGPIKKDKAFFLATYEATRQRQGIPILGGVLSDAGRAAVTDPTVQKLLDFIPHQNTTITTSTGVIPAFGGSGTAPVNIDQWTGDLSYYLSANDRIHGYYAFQKDLRNEPTLQGNSVPGFGDTRQSHRQIFTLNEIHTFSSHLVNEARFGFNRIHITFSPIVKLNPADFGINEGVNSPIALPQISVASTLNFGGPAGFPQGRGDTTFVFSDTASYLHGRHSFNIGGEFRSFSNNNFAQTAGTFNFISPSVPVTRDGLLDPFALFEQGKANSFANTVGSTDSSLLTRSFGVFLQDNFKAKPNLTLELGLRWDVNTPPSERFHRLVNFDPATGSLIQVGSGLDQIYRTNKKHFQPRLGFAWDTTRDGKTVLRGAYAILYDQPVTNSVTPTAGNPPLATPLSVTSSANAI